MFIRQGLGLNWDDEKELTELDFNIGKLMSFIGPAQILQNKDQF